MFVIHRWSSITVVVGCILIWTVFGFAQTAVTTTGGTTNSVPKFSGTSTLTNSSITDLNGNVGIGTANPAYALSVQGGFTQIGAFNTATIPASDLVHGGLIVSWNHSQYYGEVNLYIVYPNAYGQNAPAFTFDQVTPSGSSARYMQINANGNIGVGTPTPAYKLDVAGAIHSSTGGVVFPDGTTQTTAFIPANCGADYAESVPVTGDRAKYEPGDVLVIDPNNPGNFLKADQAYSTMVSGIYSTKPGFIGRLHPADDKRSAVEVPMAMVGRVPTKVSTENGPIKVGDLLVSSTTPGYAMKGTDRGRMFGAVVGKALESIDSGTGVIEVLVTLQ